MSTAVDTAFEELMAAGGDALPPLHIVCGICHPDSGPGTVMLCGHVAIGPAESDWRGRHMCAKCLALDVSPLPCGHP